MQRKFLTNLVLLLFLNLLVKPFWIFGIDRTVQNIVGSEEYGFYFAIFNFTIIFNILLDFGITNFNNRNIAQNNQLLNKHFSSIVILRLLLAVVYTIVAFAVAWIWWGYDPRLFHFLGILAFNQFLLSFILYLRSNISGLLLFKTDSLLSVLDRFLMIIICGFLIWVQAYRVQFKIEWFVYAQSVAYILTALTAGFIVVRKARFKRLKWNRPFFIMIIKQSFPFAVLTLLMAIYNRVDTVLLTGILPEQQGDMQSGIYAHAFRPLDAFNQIAYLFAVLLLPIFSRMIKLKDDIVHLVRLAFSLLFTVSVVVAVGSYFYSYEIMELFYHDDNIAVSADVFRIIIYGFIAISTTYVFGTLLTANGSLKKLNLIAAGGMIISIGINLLLIPRLMAVGSAIASVSAQFVTAVIQFALAAIIFKFRINFRYISVLVVYVVFVFLTSYFSRYLPFGWIVNIMIMILSAIIMAVALRLLNVRELIRIVKEG